MFAISRLPVQRATARCMYSTVTPSILTKVSAFSSPKILHQSSIAMAILVPVAVAVNPSMLSVPVDLALSVAMPVHSAIAGKCVIEDYVPRSGQTIATAAWFAVCGLSTLGLIKLSITGAGLTNTVKELWREN